MDFELVGLGCADFAINDDGLVGREIDGHLGCFDEFDLVEIDVVTGEGKGADLGDFPERRFFDHIDF